MVLDGKKHLSSLLSSANFRNDGKVSFRQAVGCSNDAGSGSWKRISRSRTERSIFQSTSSVCCSGFCSTTLPGTTNFDSIRASPVLMLNRP